MLLQFRTLSGCYCSCNGESEEGWLFLMPLINSQSKLRFKISAKTNGQRTTDGS